MHLLKRNSVLHTPYEVPNRRMLLILLAALTGCTSSSDRLVVATNWTVEECRRVNPSSANIDWIRVTPGDDPAKVLESGRRVDVILGAPLSRYRQLLLQGRLAELDLPNKPCWLLVRRSAAPTKLGNPRVAEFSAMDDPRTDPDQWGVKAILQAKSWRDAYAQLVLSAGGGAAPRLDPSCPANQPAAVVEGCAHPIEAFAFVKSLPTTTNLASETTRIEPLVADLLGCVLVEAQDELTAANEILKLENSPKAAVALMTEPPPWPPASITRMKSKPEGDALLATLAQQIAPDPAVRVWLTSSWNRDPMPIDANVLNQLVEAADGRLIAEPRFRSWLRTEWTAWARQRYRRVALRASAGDLP